MKTATQIFCDLEGVLIPEMWPHLADVFEIAELAITTRDIPDYRGLMQTRLSVLRKNGICIADICCAVSRLKPFDGAVEFIKELGKLGNLIIVSDSFSPMNNFLLTKLAIQNILCHRFVIDNDGLISECIYWNNLAGKHLCLEEYPSQNGITFAIGDAFNDLSMIRAATSGVLFNPSSATAKVAPDLITTTSYAKVLTLLKSVCTRSSNYVTAPPVVAEMPHCVLRYDCSG